MRAAGAARPAGADVSERIRANDHASQRRVRPTFDEPNLHAHRHVDSRANDDSKRDGNRSRNRSARRDSGADSNGSDPARCCNSSSANADGDTYANDDRNRDARKNDGNARQRRISVHERCAVPSRSLQRAVPAMRLPMQEQRARLQSGQRLQRVGPVHAPRRRRSRHVRKTRTSR